jgi:hypothetical protein
MLQHLRHSNHSQQIQIKAAARLLFSFFRNALDLPQVPALNKY